MTDARSMLRVDDVTDAHSQATVLAVTGELDLATVSILKDAVTPRLAPATHVVLNLAELTFCDSTGLGAFIGLHRAAKSSGARLVLAAPRRRVGDLFTLSGIDQVISVYASQDDAFAAVEPAG